MMIDRSKLRQLKLEHKLDANGWAVNSQARINIAFGTALTQLATLPGGSARSLRDPYAARRPVWPWLLLLVVVLGLALFGLQAGWFSASVTPPAAPPA